MAIERACALLEKYAGGKVVTGTIVYDKTNKEDKQIEITFKNINDVLGTNIENKDIIDTFDYDLKKSDEEMEKIRKRMKELEEAQ